MGLGNRTAKHDTAQVQKVAVDSTLWWEYKPEQRVMTIDGIAGTVTAVLDGPHPGSEAYEVRLDNGMGGGQYTASQLSRASTTTASHEHEATGLHLAHEDYPELGSILYDRPPIERVEHTASRPFVAEAARKAVDWDTVGAHYPHIYGDPEVHGEAAEGSDGPGIGEAANHLAHEHVGNPQAENTSVHDLTFHPEYVDPKHIDYARHGLSDPRVAQAHAGYKKDGGKGIPPLVLVHRHGVYQVADGHHRAEAAHAAGVKGVPALVAYSPHPNEPFSDGEVGPFHGAEPHAGNQRTAAVEPPTGEQMEPELPPCSYCGNPSLAISGDNGRNVQATCGTCQATMSSWGGQFTPELIGDPSNHPSQQPDKDSGGVGGAGNPYGPQPVRQMNDADHTAAKHQYNTTVQGPNGYEDQTHEIEGPLYHGGRADVSPGDHITVGRKPNPWGDDGGKSTHVYFSTDLDTAHAYADQVGRKGKVYEVEPTGEFKHDRNGVDFKTKHPLRVVREVPRGHTASLRRVAEEDYRMQHQPPDAEDGSPLHDLTHDGSYPADVYTHTHYYADYSDTGMHESVSAMHQARGKPNKKVKIYRAMPADSVHHGIQQGNWVTTSKEYARQHGRHHEDSKKDWPVISATVEAQHLRTDGNDLREYGYHGPNVEQHGVAFGGGHDEKVSARADGTVRKVQRKPKAAETHPGFSFSHYKRSGGHDEPDVRGVTAYDANENYAGNREHDHHGNMIDSKVEPEHETTGLHERMEREIHARVKKFGSLSFLASLDSETLFQFTAAWSDVRAKAKRLRAEGSVRITVASSDGIGGEVKGDNNVYETVLSYAPGSQKVAYWTCGCKWAAYAWGRSPAYKRFEGRMCSHALAMQFEAQSRGMFGRTVQPDETRPKWLRQRTPVVIQHERDTGKDLTRRTVPPGNMRRTFEGSLVGTLDEPPIVHLARFALHEHGEPVDVMCALMDAGFDHTSAKRVLRRAMGAGEKICPDCDSPISAQASRCPHCGAELSTPDSGDMHLASRIAGRVSCGECEGAGTIEHEVEPTDEEAENADHVPGKWHETCDVCDGSGRVDLESLHEPEEDPRTQKIREHNESRVNGAPHGVGCPPFCPIQQQMPLEHRQRVREEWHGKQGAKSTQDGPTHAGVVLKARDTGRILMLQRNLEDEKDKAAGTWEWPGGGIEEGDATTLHAGIREWEEEVGQKFPQGGAVHHVWSSPNGVYHGHVVVIPEERQVELHNGRVTVNPDDPGGDHHEQAAWWDPEHARKNPALRPECKSSPWKEIGKAGANAKTAAAWDLLEELDQGHTPPLHSESENPGSTGFATAQDPPEFDHPTINTTLYSGVWASLHDQPEPALPSTDGADEDFDNPALWVVEQHPATHDQIPPLSDTLSPQQFTGSVQDIVARFQATAGAQAINTGAGAAEQATSDIAGAAKAYLEKTALKDFTFREQQELITEGAVDSVMARNVDRLDIANTHYSAIDEALAAEEAVAHPEDLFA